MDTQVSQLTHLTQRAHTYFLDYVGASFEALTGPVDAAQPAGRSMRGTSIYSTIEKARRYDDASVPMGGWEHDLKRADWDKVTAVAAGALRHKSKDLQLAAWLLEAQINKNGFAAIGPCLLLMQTLCERYWKDLYPEAENGDLEFRANIFRWVNEKLLPTLRLVPITAAGRDRDYCWADWEQAHRNEQLREQLRANQSGRQDALEGATVTQMTAAITGTPTEAYAFLFETLIGALTAIDLVTDTLDRLLGQDAPSLGKLGDLLAQILSLVEAELNKRGFHLHPGNTNDVTLEDEEIVVQPESQHAIDSQAVVQAPVAPSPASSASPASPAAIRSRSDAYARLAEAADFLARTEPHSPVPYLVNRAVEWGRMNTADLYQELFLKMGGQFNIFEMLGLQTGEPQGGQQ